jgi:cysteinyl-tRNA synthetase
MVVGKIMITVYNTLTKQKEEFVPLKSNVVKMYNCGPTVYNYVHIGNLRSNVFADVLRRVFEYNDYSVTQVVNITDIGHLKSDADEGEDKMTNALRRENKPLNLESLNELASFYTEAFLSDLKKLNIQTPTHIPKASDHIREDIELIEKLEKKNFIYTTSDGIYFDTSKDLKYGKLGGINKNPLETESRIESNLEKRNPNDFALWKFNKEFGWESKWGHGFPGWHIECSAMAMKYLGETFDIHTGGIDHISIHHNNEIAQSENATEKTFAKYWMHNAFININDEKIAKSTGNTIYLKNIEEKSINPLAYRYLLLGANYRTPMNFTWEALEGAEKALNRISLQLREINGSGEIDRKYKDRFIKFINDDLDTPKALALVFEVLNDTGIRAEDKKTTILDFDRVLGLNLKELSKDIVFKIPDEVRKLVEEREVARQKKDWQKSDEYRKEINEAGFEIKDTDQGPIINKFT